jgi:hypothetical protein
MTTFKTIRRETTIEFAVKTRATVTTPHGTKFVVNRCETRIYGDEIVSITLSLLDENGYGIDDPNGPEGSELYVSYGGGQLSADYRDMLPKVAQDALAEIEKAVR